MAAMEVKTGYDYIEEADRILQQAEQEVSGVNFQHTETTGTNLTRVWVMKATLVLCGH